MNTYRDNLARTLIPMSHRNNPRLANHQLPDVADKADEQPRSLRLEDVVREHITQVLKQRDWVIEGQNGAAAALDMKPSTLRYRIRLLNIQRPPKTDAEEPITFVFRNNRIPFRT